MTLPGDLTTTIVTGQFVSTSGVPVIGTITFSPTSTLLDPTSQMVIPASGSAYPISSMGTFQTDPLISTDNADLEPQGWAYNVKVELQDLQPYTFTCFLPSSPSTVDLSALEPVFPAGTTLGPAGTYLPATGGTETGPLVLDGDPPLVVPGATLGQILASDASGNFTLQGNTAGNATSVDGVAVTGITAAGRVIMATSPTAATWQLPLQVDTSAGDIANLAASASAGVLTQAAAADHAHATTGLVTTTGNQSIGGNKTFSGTTAFSGEVTVQTPSNPSDAVTKTYADSIASGLNVQAAAAAATVASESYTYTIVSGSVTTISSTTIDGVTLTSGQLVLVKDCPATTGGTGSALSSEPGNGLYQVSSASGTLSVTRAAGMTGSETPIAAFVFVAAGTVNKGAGYVVTTPAAGSGAFTYGSGNIQWAQFSSAASVSADGTTLTQTGGVISLTVPVTVARGGTNAITQQAAINNLAGAVTSGDYLRGDGTNVTMSALAAGDLTGNVPINHGGTGAGNAAAAITALTGTQTGKTGNYLRSDGTNASLQPLAAADLTGTVPAGTLPAATTSAQGAIELGGGTTNFLRADGSWSAPPGGGASIDTTDAPQALGTASPGTSTNGASAWNHVHPTTGLLTTSAPVDTSHGGTGVNAASGSDALVQMAGSAGAPALGKYMRGNGSAIQLANIAATDLPGASNSAQGAVILDGPAATDIATSPGTAAAGTIGKAADAGHVHGQPPMLAPTGLTGAASASRYVGAVSGAAPATGTFVVGDWVVDKGGTPGFWICTTPGSPGTWSHIVTGTGLANPMTTLGDTLYGNTPSGGVAPAARLAPGTLGQVLTAKPGSTPPVQWTSGPADYINVVSQYGADPTGSADATTAIRNALNAAPLGGTVYLPAGTYKVSSPLVVPPTVTLLGSGQSFAYDGGSIAMTIATPVLVPTAAFSTSTAVGGQTVLGVITFVDSSLGGGTGLYASGSSNQAVRNITINGTNITAGTTVYGIAAYGPVWGVKIEDVGIFRMPNYGIFTNTASAGSDTTHFPDVWQLTGVHVAGCHNDGIHMTSIGDSYFVACESTGNSATGGGFANGWTISGDNIKMIGCKAEYNTGIGLSISRGNAARPILVNGFGTDGNGHGGIQITGTGGAGPVVLSGVGLNYDGQNNGAGGNFAALSITGGAHVTATGLHVTTGILGASHLFPQYGVQCPSTFTGVLQIENSEIYGGTAAVNLDATASGTVRFGPNVLTGSGDWSAQSLANIVQAPSPQTDLQQYAKYWSPSAGAGGNWVTSTQQQPRESMPWYAVSGNPTIASGQMLCAAIPVMPGDSITKLGFIVGATAAALTAGGSGPHWWVALYTTGGAALIGQSADQGAATLTANTAHLLTLTAASGFTIPYQVPAGVYSLLGVVMVNSNGGTQPSLRGISQQAVLNGGTNDLFTGSTVYAATVGAAGSNGGATAPAGPLTLAVATSFAYMGAC